MQTVSLIVIKICYFMTLTHTFVWCFIK